MKPIWIAGSILSFAIVINFYIILFVAMMHGGKVTVYFNIFGEAVLEYIVYLIILPFIVYSFWLKLKMYRKHRRERKEAKHA